MSSELVSLNLDKDMIKGIVEKHVQAGILHAFGDQNLAEQIISKVITTKVDSEGKISNYSSYNKHDLIETTLRAELVKLTRECIVEAVISKKDIIKKTVEKHIEKNKSKLVNAFTEALINNASSSYNFKIEFGVEKKGDWE